MAGHRGLSRTRRPEGRKTAWGGATGPGAVRRRTASAVASDVQTLFRQEAELARTELRAKAGKAAGLHGGAGFAGYMKLRFLSLAAVPGLANAMDPGRSERVVPGVRRGPCA